MHDYSIFDIIYGDVNIGAMVDAITDIDRGIGSSWENDMAKGYGRYGSSWVGGRISSKTITIQFLLYGDQRRLTKFRRDLAIALDTTNGTKRLTFNDEPNIYYNAVINDKISTSSDISKLEFKGTISFIVPDGLAHSTYRKVLSTSSSSTENGSITSKGKVFDIVLNNEGGVECFPTIKIHNRSDNGYYGLVHNNGIMELGVKNASASGSLQDTGLSRAETLIDISMSNPDSWAKYSTQFQDAYKTIKLSPWSDKVGMIKGGLSIGTDRNGWQTHGVHLDLTGANINHPIHESPNLLQNSDGPFEPPTGGSDNYLELQNVTINLVQGKQYTISAYTNGVFSNKHGADNSVPNKVTLWLINRNNSVFEIVSDSKTATTGTTFSWNKPSGKYYLRVNHYNRTTPYSAWKIKIEEGVNRTGSLQNESIEYIDGRDLLTNKLDFVGKDFTALGTIIDIPKDSSGAKGAKNFSCHFNLNFWESKIGQTGMITVCMLDHDNRLIAAYDVSKLDNQGETASVKYWTTRNVVNKTIDFGANNNEPNQMNPNVTFSENRGNCYITKSGPEIRFSYYGLVTTSRNSVFENQVCDKIMIAIGKSNSMTSAGIVSKMTLNSLKFIKSDAKRLDMVSNKYNKDSVVTIDMYNGMIYLSQNDKTEGVPAQQELVQGSEFFSVPPGESRMQLLVSDWCQEMPSVELSWEESWL